MRRQWSSTNNTKREQLPVVTMLRRICGYDKQLIYKSQDGRDCGMLIFNFAFPRESRVCGLPISDGIKIQPLLADNLL
jgi:hypothetical protein